MNKAKGYTHSKFKLPEGKGWLYMEEHLETHALSCGCGYCEHSRISDQLRQGDALSAYDAIIDLNSGLNYSVLPEIVETKFCNKVFTQNAEQEKGGKIQDHAK